jgi:hypothetical protein
VKAKEIPKDTNDIGKEMKREIHKKNHKAYHLIILSMSGESPHSMVSFTIVG